MPVKPRPFTYECEACGWRKTVAPRSDALRPGEWFDACPKCGAEALKMRAAGWFEGALAEFLARRGV
jgi:Zn finger protein HypA/HybF involved in hydrogenase expression